MDTDSEHLGTDVVAHALEQRRRACRLFVAAPAG
jgi:hypothetical protein